MEGNSIVFQRLSVLEKKMPVADVGKEKLSMFSDWGLWIKPAKYWLTKEKNGYNLINILFAPKFTEEKGNSKEGLKSVGLGF